MYCIREFISANSHFEKFNRKNDFNKISYLYTGILRRFQETTNKKTFENFRGSST